jgi:glycosyltransferase involved in cell wall biosynthesis
MCAVNADEVCMNPLVSVGIPTYNRPKGLRLTLESITGQTYRNLEIIVSDNCSSDQEVEAVVKEFQKKDNRIQYFKQPDNFGPMNNFKFVLEKATGEYFMWATNDDEWKTTFIESLLTPLREDAKCVTAFCPYIFIDVDGHAINESRIIDYSSQYRIIRFLKLCVYYDDAFIYGLHKTKAVKNIKLPVWWSINAKSPYNTAYPILFYLLSTGDFALTGSSPLWFNRLRLNAKLNEYHCIPFVTENRNLILAYFAFVLRKINVFYECERSIWQGSRSIFNVLICFLPLLGRCGYDCFKEPIIYGIPLLNALKSKT